jgi:hypothetical protein
LVGFDVMVEEAFSTNPRPGKQERCQQSRAQKGSSGGDGLAEGRPTATPPANLAREEISL